MKKVLDKIKKIPQMAKNTIKKIDIFDILIFVIVIAIFGIIAYIFAPGIMTADSIDQWNQTQTGIYSNVHSVLHTFIQRIITRVYNSPIAVGIFQILVFAIIWTFLCHKTRNNSKAIGIIQIITTILICIMPINFMYSITLWKDVLYSYCALMVVYGIYLGVKNDFKYTTLQLISIAFFIFLTMKLRHNGIAIGALVTLFLFIAIWKKGKSRKNSFKLVIFLTIFLILLQVCFAFLDITHNATEAQKRWFSMYKVGVFYQNGAITDEEELKMMEEILPLELWYRYTWDYTMNGLVFAQEVNHEKLNYYSQDILDMMFKYVFERPDIMVKHYLNLTSVIWQLDQPEDAYTSILQSQIQKNNLGFAHDEGRPYEEVEDMINKSVEKFKIFYRPAIYMYGSIILVVYIICKTKNKLYLFTLLPMLSNALSLVPTLTGQDVRYLYINFLTFYFLLLVVFEVISTQTQKKLKENIESSKKIIKENPKTLIIVPAYNEEEAIKKVVNDIKSKNPKCDVAVVNDGSKDNTLNEARQTEAIILDLPNNLGIGGAVQTGFLYAYKNDYDIAIQIDGDGQHDSSYVSKMVDYIVKENYNMVIGSRFVEKTQYKQTFFRMLGINITSGIIKMMTGTKIHDTTSGYRAVDRNIIEYFAKNYPYDYPEPDTNMQMILKGMKIKEIPVEMNQRTTGVSSISPLKSINYMLKVSLSLILTRIRKL